MAKRRGEMSTHRKVKVPHERLCEAPSNTRWPQRCFKKKTVFITPFSITHAEGFLGFFAFAIFALEMGMVTEGMEE